ncbi:MAG: hypothetical protein QXE51_03370 [Nitrososphaeria archaeon]
MHLLAWFRVPALIRANKAMQKLEEIAHRHFIRVDYLIPICLAGYRDDIKEFLKELMENGVHNNIKFVQGIRDKNYNYDFVLDDNFNIIPQVYLKSKEESRKTVDEFEIKFLDYDGSLEIVLFAFMPLAVFSDHKDAEGKDLI